VKSIIKKITGGDLVRVEVKFEQPTTQRFNLFLLVSTNYQVNSGTTTDYVAMQRRSIKLPLLNFVPTNKKKDNFSQSLPPAEKKALMLLFLNNTDSFEKIFSKFNSYNIDHNLLLNNEKNYFNLIDPIFSFLSLKCSYDTNNVISFYKFYALYIQYHFFEYDTLITIENYKLFKLLLKSVINDPFNTQKFNKLISFVSILATNLDLLDPLLHLPKLSQNTFMSYFSIIESRLPFLIENINLNSVKLVSSEGSYKKTTKLTTGETKTEIIPIRLLSIKGINELSINKIYQKSLPEVLPEVKPQKEVLPEVKPQKTIRKKFSDSTNKSIYIDHLNGMSKKQILMKYNIKKTKYYKTLKDYTVDSLNDSRYPSKMIETENIKKMSKLNNKKTTDSRLGAIRNYSQNRTFNNIEISEYFKLFITTTPFNEKNYFANTDF
jgi:hypothetical protein